jgi:glycosyltransferase involved in cell wall biosynthesis
VYAIRQFASRLEGWSVSLAVRKGGLEEIPGIAVVRDAPDADVCVIPADSVALDGIAGAPILLFQGYGEPGNEDVVRNLDTVRKAICTASWLVDEARSRDAMAELVPYGLDRSLFYPGEPAAERGPLVGMLTHRAGWKGTEDGLRALRMACAEIPECQPVLFGSHQPDVDMTFVDSPSRAEIGALMRRIAVFVCPSWEEGFGMPGLEAMACGAALATTDTKGSRDYAHDGHTALVTPPRAPELLAESIVELLRDRRLRARLAGEGQLVAAGYPDWQAATVRFASALEILAK